MNREVWIFVIDSDNETNGREHNLFEDIEAFIRTRLEREGWRVEDVFLDTIETAPITITGPNSERRIRVPRGSS